MELLSVHKNSVIILSPYPKRIARFIERPWESTDDPMPIEDMKKFGIGVSYGYRHIIRPVPIPIVNIHISLLPWNRGADPNIWSWIDDTPKGVTLHWMDEGIDTGPIIAQRVVEMDETETFRSSYEKLQANAEDLFRQWWPIILQGRGGSYHRSKDLDGLRHKIRYDDTIWDFLDELAEAQLSGQYHDNVMKAINDG